MIDKQRVRIIKIGNKIISDYNLSDYDSSYHSGSSISLYNSLGHKGLIQISIAAPNILSANEILSLQDIIGKESDLLLSDEEFINKEREAADIISKLSDKELYDKLKKEIADNISFFNEELLSNISLIDNDKEFTKEAVLNDRKWFKMKYNELIETK